MKRALRWFTKKVAKKIGFIFRVFFYNGLSLSFLTLLKGIFNNGIYNSDYIISEIKNVIQLFSNIFSNIKMNEEGVGVLVKGKILRPCPKEPSLHPPPSPSEIRFFFLFSRFRIFHVNFINFEKIYILMLHDTPYAQKTLKLGFSSMPLMPTCSD